VSSVPPLPVLPPVPIPTVLVILSHTLVFVLLLILVQLVLKSLALLIVLNQRDMESVMRQQGFVVVIDRGLGTIVQWMERPWGPAPIPTRPHLEPRIPKCRLIPSLVSSAFLSACSLALQPLVPNAIVSSSIYFFTGFGRNKMESLDWNSNLSYFSGEDDWVSNILIEIVR